MTGQDRPDEGSDAHGGLLDIVVVAHHRLADGVRGAEGVAAALVREWTTSGHHVGTLSFDDLPAPVRNPRVAAVVFPWYVPLALRRRDPDLVDATTGDTWLYSALLRIRAPRRGRPFVVSRSHGFEHLAERARTPPDPPRRLVVRLLRDLYFAGWRLWEVAASARAADLVRVLNDREHAFVVDELRIPGRRVVTGPNGFPVGAGAPDLPPPPFAVAVVGSFDSGKRPGDVGRAFRRLRESVPDATIHVLGSGTSEDVALAFFDPRDRRHVVHVERFDPEDLPGLLAPCHAYLSASASEGFSLALVEAMSLGLVPVVTDAGAAVAVVGDAGHVVAVGNHRRIGDLLVGLAADPASLEATRDAAVAAVAGLDWRSVATRTLDDYRSAGLRARPRTARSR